MASHAGDMGRTLKAEGDPGYRAREAVPSALTAPRHPTGTARGPRLMPLPQESAQPSVGIGGVLGPGLSRPCRAA